MSLELDIVSPKSGGERRTSSERDLSGKSVGRGGFSFPVSSDDEHSFIFGGKEGRFRGGSYERRCKEANVEKDKKRGNGAQAVGKEARPLL